VTNLTIREARQLAFEQLFRSKAADENLAIDRHFPESFADTLSRLEVYNKHLFRPNTYLHKWWARRCGSTFRTILKQFVVDPKLRDYYAPGGLEGRIVLDPMMGGGTTLHEAIRLGANVIGADIDPIPIIQARASLSPVTLSDLQLAFERFFADLYGHIGHLFQTECPECGDATDLQYTLHGLRKRCGCGEVVQIDSYLLRQEAERDFQICPDTWEIVTGPCDHEPKQPIAERLVLKTETRCPDCGQKYQELLDTPFYARYVPIAIVGQCERHGLFLRTPSSADLARIVQANELRTDLDFGLADNFAVQNGPKSGDLIRHKVLNYLDAFSSRQLLTIHHALRILGELERPIRLNLALLVSTSLEFNSMLCGYKGSSKNRPGAIRHVFALHAYSFPYTAAENNPVNRRRSSGNLQQLFQDRIVRGRKWSVSPIERRIDQAGKTSLVEIPGEWDGGVEVSSQTDLQQDTHRFWLIHGDSSRLPVADHSVDFVVTDPPYYDNVQYSDLAAFFRVWLAHLLPDEIDWHYDENRSAVATKSDQGDTGFVTGLSGIFRECARVLKPNKGRLVFTFHHWDPNAWAELSVALQSAGFRLVNAHVVFSENPVSVHINNLNAIQHDTILVLEIGDEAAIPHWIPLDSIDTSDSATFCWQCGAALGWMLENNLTGIEIRTLWKNLIQDKGNGKTPR
jgi:DNA modification methylase